LKLKKCDEPAIREKLNTDAEAEWNEKNLKAMNYIYCSISNEQLEFIGDKDTALDIFKKFDEIYLKKSTAQICTRNRLDRMKLKDFEESSTFFSEIEKIINQLKSAGAAVNEREKLDYMLKTLPDSLSYIGDLVDTMKECDRTCEFLKNKIVMWETRSQSEKGKTKSSVFKVEKKDIQCYQCKERGHTKKNCCNSWRGAQAEAEQIERRIGQEVRTIRNSSSNSNRDFRGNTGAAADADTDEAMVNEDKAKDGSRITTELDNTTPDIRATSVTTFKRLNPF